MKLSAVILFSLLIIPVYSQSVYLDSLENKISASLERNETKNLAGTGFSLALSLKGSFNIGFSYLNASDKSVDDEGEYPSSTNYGFYTSYAFANEVSGDPFGVELAFLFLRNSLPNEIRTNSYGLGISASKRLKETPISFFLPQIFFVYVPISITKLEGYSNNNNIIENFSTLSLSLAFVLRITPNANLVLEPLGGYNFKSQDINYGFSFTIQR